MYVCKCNKCYQNPNLCHPCSPITHKHVAQSHKVDVLQLLLATSCSDKHTLSTSARNRVCGHVCLSAKLVALSECFIGMFFRRSWRFNWMLNAECWACCGVGCVSAAGLAIWWRSSSSLQSGGRLVEPPQETLHGGTRLLCGCTLCCRTREVSQNHIPASDWSGDVRKFFGTAVLTAVAAARQITLFF